MALNTGDVPYAVITASGAENPENRLTVEFAVRDETGRVDEAFIAAAIRQALTDSGVVTNVAAVRYTTATTELR